MTFTGISRIAAAFIAVSVAAVFLIATEIVAQSSATVDCGNGFYCPRGNACLVGGLCGPEVDQPPGSVRISGGKYCDPGFREHRYRPGTCVPGSYSDCADGLTCSPGSSCAPNGGCEGGPPRTGPMCGNDQCEAGRISAPAPGDASIRSTSRTAAMARFAPKRPAVSIRKVVSSSVRRGRSRFALSRLRRLAAGMPQTEALPLFLAC